MKKILLFILLPLLFTSCEGDKNYLKSTNEVIELFNTTSNLSYEITDLYSEVWKIAITKGTYRNEFVGTDFNIALNLAKTDIEKEGAIQTLDDAQIKIDSLVKSLNDHPSKYKSVYDDTITCYGYVSELIDLAKTPNGTLQSYSQRTEELKAKISTKIKEIKIKLP